MKCIEIFLIYVFLFLKNLNDVIVINFILGSPFHIIFFNVLHGIILSITCLGIFIGWFINIYDLKNWG